jgi:hypothetical protein
MPRFPRFVREGDSPLPDVMRNAGEPRRGRRSKGERA